ncbi:MAG: protein-export chaperone SecB [Alphaproteobacteria bacterium]|nr:protein-export chaperone SecB [Alphaproteobacteria bacterium]
MEEKEIQTDQSPQPTLVVNAQYVKDLSFENPNAPKSLLQQETEPNVQVGIDTAANKLEDSVFEVTLTIRAEGSADDTNLFMAEVSYSGVFSIGETPEEYIAPLLYVEAPRLLFPFARAIIAECVREGGYPPLLIHPVDFMSLFQQRAQQAQKTSQEDLANETNEEFSKNGKGDQKFEFEI